MLWNSMENAVNSSHFILLPSHALCLDQLYFSFCTTLYNWVLPGWPKKKRFFDFRYWGYTVSVKDGGAHILLGSVMWLYTWTVESTVQLITICLASEDPRFPVLWLLYPFCQKRWCTHFAWPNDAAVHWVHCTLVLYILYILAPAWPQQRFGEWAYSDQ